MDDGSRVKIKIEYKPKSQISGDEKFGSYYYIVQHFAPKPSPPTKTKGQEDKTKTKDPIEEWVQNFTPREQRGILQLKQTRYIEISFYDRKGYLIGRKFSPGWNHDEDEENRIDGGWEWKGQFDESYITVQNFRDIHSIKVIKVTRASY